MSQAERSLPDARAVARETKRIVVKVGSAVLSKGDITLHQPTLQRICRELVSLRKEGHQVVLVSSGAILAGMGRLGLTERPGSIPLKQAAAAVGQSLLMRRYEEVFAPYGQKLGQLLLTQDDFRSRHRYLNARNTLFTLLHLGVLPIINENDTVAVEEIRFGDNDRLSALVATLLGADLLVILTDLDGLYTADPRKDPHARLVHEVPRRSTGLHFWADESGTGLGTGGMATKVRAARTAAAAGVPTIIANGLVEGSWSESSAARQSVPSFRRLRPGCGAESAGWHLRRHVEGGLWWMPGPRRRSSVTARACCHPALSRLTASLRGRCGQPLQHRRRRIREGCDQL